MYAGIIDTSIFAPLSPVSQWPCSSIRRETPPFDYRLDQPPLSTRHLATPPPQHPVRSDDWELKISLSLVCLSTASTDPKRNLFAASLRSFFSSSSSSYHLSRQTITVIPIPCSVPVFHRHESKKAFSRHSTSRHNNNSFQKGKINSCMHLQHCPTDPILFADSHSCPICPFPFLPRQSQSRTGTASCTAAATTHFWLPASPPSLSFVFFFFSGLPPTPCNCRHPPTTIASPSFLPRKRPTLLVNIRAQTPKSNPSGRLRSLFSALFYESSHSQCFSPPAIPAFRPQPAFGFPFLLRLPTYIFLVLNISFLSLLLSSPFRQLVDHNIVKCLPSLWLYRRTLFVFLCPSRPASRRHPSSASPRSKISRVKQLHNGKPQQSTRCCLPAQQRLAPKRILCPSRWHRP